MRRNIVIDKDLLLREYSEGLPTEELCIKFNISEQTLYRRLRQWGIPHRKSPFNRTIFFKSLWENGILANRNRDPIKVAKSLKAATLAGHSPEAKAKRSKTMTVENKKRYKFNSHWNNTFNRETKPELILRNILLAEFPTVEKEKGFGPYRVDAYLPEYHLAFEADGDYWHSLKGRQASDKKRDRWLLKHFNLPVIRLWERELVAMEGY